MADPLLSAVVQSLTSMATQELKLLMCVKEDLRNLSDTFNSLQHVLRDAEKQQVQKQVVRNWLGTLKDVAYDMNDVLEEWEVVFDSCDNGTSSGDKKGCANSSSPCFCLDRVWIYVETCCRIKDITERLDQIKKQRETFDFREIEGRAVIELDTMETTSLITETEIFGRELDKEKIVRWLGSDGSISENGIPGISIVGCEGIGRRNENDIPVIFIVGTGGIGKTTLAQLVCKDDTVKRRFGKPIWVSLHNNFDVKKIYLAIIRTSERTLSGSESLEDLESLACISIGKKQFLVVLDGVRDVDGVQWERLMRSLDGAVTGSRILVTTRNKHVMKSLFNVYELKPLADNACRLYFSHRAFPGGRTGGELVSSEAWHKIVNKSQGIPLLVKAMGDAICGKLDEQDWKHVLEEEKWDWKGAENIAPTLSVSFHDLPPYLKQCFTFCFIFRKGDWIEKDKLIKLWMAQGFIAQGEMEREGGSYFDDLMGRSLFQLRDDGDAKYCKMHDVIHDLRKFIMSGCFIIQKKKTKRDLAKARHASWIRSEDVQAIPSFIHKACNLRTLLLIGQSKIPSISGRFFRSLKRLRALDFSGSRLEKLPNSMQNLKLLRYLDLSATEIRELPNFVSSLSLLQTLKLNDCNNLCKLSRGIVKLINLRHLEFKGTNLEYLPEGIGSLTSLRTLTKFVLGGVGGCKITELKDLNLLQGKLEITYLNRVATTDEGNKAILENMRNLQTLQLSGEGSRDSDIQLGVVEQEERVFESLGLPANLRDLTISEYIGRQFPSWMGNCELYSNLSKVELSHCRSTLMPPLWKLPSLKWLKLEAIQVKQLGSEFCGNSQATGIFPKLEILIFRCMEIWDEWELNAGAGSIPFLFQLSICSCMKLKALPKLQHLTSLRELEISDCPILHNRCQKQVGDDWDKIAHIPNITIDGRKIQSEEISRSATMQDESLDVLSPFRMDVVDQLIRDNFKVPSLFELSIPFHGGAYFIIATRNSNAIGFPPKARQMRLTLQSSRRI